MEQLQYGLYLQGNFLKENSLVNSLLLKRLQASSIFGSGQEGAAVLLPGFAINW